MGEDSLAASSFQTWGPHLDTHHDTYEEGFNSNNCFGIEIIYRMDSNYQRFVKPCPKAENKENIDWQYLISFENEQGTIIKRKFRAIRGLKLIH